MGQSGCSPKQGDGGRSLDAVFCVWDHPPGLIPCISLPFTDLGRASSRRGRVCICSLCEIEMPRGHMMKVKCRTWTLLRGRLSRISACKASCRDRQSPELPSGTHSPGGLSWRGDGWRSHLCSGPDLGDAKPWVLGQHQLQNSQGPVQNGNAEPLVQKSREHVLPVSWVSL